MKEFAEYCGKIYAEEIEKDLLLEQENEAYLSQDAFSDSASRMKAISYDAEKRVDNFKNLCNLKHRQKEHGESNEKEIAVLEASMPTEDIEASTRIWWVN